MVRKNSTVTLKDIAQELGLSVKAVSTGLNGTGRLSPETRKKIQEAARRMGYTPNVAARSLVTHRSSFIGVLVPYLNSSFFGNIIAGIEEVAENTISRCCSIRWIAMKTGSGGCCRG